MYNNILYFNSNWKSKKTSIFFEDKILEKNITGTIATRLSVILLIVEKVWFECNVIPIGWNKTNAATFATISITETRDDSLEWSL